MKRYIKKLLREGLLSEDDDIKQKLMSLLKSGDIDNIELAYALGKGQKINVDELVKSIYGEFLLNKAKGKTIKDKLINLTNLDVLGLHNNELKSLPDWIGKLKNLRRLYLSGNRLKSLPESIGNLTNLKKLDLHNNELKSLPESIENLTNLRGLNLYDNPISDEEKERIKELLPNTDIRF
jgi:Leucine-rich repeat (LRR) protein